MQKQRKIMPTFNKNKRPHQALFPHPNNENSSNTNFQGGFPSTSTSNCGPNKRPRSTPNDRWSGRLQPINSNSRSSSSSNSSSRGGPSWASPNSSNSSFFQSNFRGNSPAPAHQNPWGPSPAPSPGYGFWGVPSAQEAESINSSWQRWAGMTHSGPPNRSHTPMRALQAGRGPDMAACPQYPPQTHPNPSSRAWYQSSNPPPNQFPPQSTRPNPTNRQVSQSAEKQRGGYTVDDRSLKVLTASIADVKSWSQHPDKIGSVVFEVFGILNSAISSNVSGVAKMFTLKDEEQTLIKCIFYETDRSLPKLTRDHWLRCMGSLEPRGGLFRCVSVRPASQAEQRVMKSLISASGNTMRERFAVVQEP